MTNGKGAKMLLFFEVTEDSGRMHRRGVACKICPVDYPQLCECGGSIHGDYIEDSDHRWVFNSSCDRCGNDSGT